MAPAPADIRELGNSPAHLALLRSFYAALYVPEFPDADERESLSNMERYLALKESGWYGANNYHIRMLVEDGRPIGGVIADYLVGPNTGVIEFLVVAPQARGRGIARMLMRDTEALLDADARAAGRPGLDAVVAEMNDPFRRPPADDSMDPFVRLLIWSRWGFRKVDFPYVQPALSETQSHVTSMFLAWKSRTGPTPDGVPAQTVLTVVHEYMRWAMRVPHPRESAEFRSMSRYLDARDRVALMPLDHYVGHDDARPLAIREVVTPDDPELPALRTLYASVFTDSATAVEAATLGAARPSEDGDVRHHLWAVRASLHGPLAGLASFFTFPVAGFAGYVALTPPLRGTGRFPLLLARLEATMVHDGLGTSGWYVESADDVAPKFLANGFHEIGIAYRSPPLRPGAALPALRLLYKVFGRSYETPVLPRDEFLDAIERIHRLVYGIARPREHALYRHIARAVATRPCVPVLPGKAVYHRGIDQGGDP
jgi:GNAT superfamily N-acetyltransferase